jgi:hypothetical protein
LHLSVLRIFCLIVYVATAFVISYAPLSIEPSEPARQVLIELRQVACWLERCFTPSAKPQRLARSVQVMRWPFGFGLQHMG